MNLKELMAEDIDDVFLDPDENADEHDIDGQTILCSLEQVGTRVRSNRRDEQYDGIYKETAVLSVRQVDLGYRPVYGQAMRVDGVLYLVSKCDDDDGLLIVTIEANES